MEKYKKFKQWLASNNIKDTDNIIGLLKKVMNCIIHQILKILILKLKLISF